MEVIWEKGSRQGLVGLTFPTGAVLGQPGEGEDCGPWGPGDGALEQGLEEQTQSYRMCFCGGIGGYHHRHLLSDVLPSSQGLVYRMLKQWQVTGPDKPIQVLVGEDVVFSCFLSPKTNAEDMEAWFFSNQFSAVVHVYKDGKDQENMQMPAYQKRTEFIKDSIAEGHVSLRLENVIPLDTGLCGCWFSSQTYDKEATWELQVSVC
ncbi:hypothetical protein HPG69_018472 [Diceros bicornis minor]|uniref:Immunoglobulin V-set domain-containing protein n=1 Tax=Diceros bicornis minor TaxID=77932 RepID=A0A7J7ER31_DICBM|nr:hypothetical protein HPG69_018472 [Diceros bicornis minor]